MTKEFGRYGGISSLVLTHTATISLGAYKGAMKYQGIDPEIPFRYLWAATTIGTATGNVTLSESFDDNNLVKIIKGTAVGAVAAPIEYAVGFGIGYFGSFVADKVFQ